MKPVAVIGAGAWGAALAQQAARAGNRVVLWARDPAGARARLPANPLPGIEIVGVPPQDAEAMLLAVPCQALRAVLSAWRPRAPLLACAKGVEAGTLRLPLEICAELHPDLPRGMLTGPNFAHEVAAGLPAAAVLAMEPGALRARLIDRLATPSFRLYGSDDPIGAQLGGAAKNVIAIAAGAVAGAGLGENARAALITRGLAELGRLAGGLGGRPETMAGLSGLGDLLLTCTGPASRNYALGLRLGRGDALSVALSAASGVVEGVATAPALVARAGALDLPICRAVAALLAGGPLPRLIERLLARPLRNE